MFTRLLGGHQVPVDAPQRRCEYCGSPFYGFGRYCSRCR